MKSVVIIEGGAMRGLYGAGVLDVLMDNNIETDAAVGVSAGALFGVNYKSKDRGRAIRYNLRFAGNGQFGLPSLIKTGEIMNKKFYFDDVPFKLDKMDFEAYRSCKTDFFATVTNLESGKAEYIKINDLEIPDNMEYLRASGSLPFLSKAVEIKGKHYLDGGVADSVPVKHFLEEGFDKVIVILTRPYGYRKSGNIHGANIFYKKHPNFAKALNNRNAMYNAQYDYIEKLEKSGKIFVIRPSKTVDIKRTETDKRVLKEIYDLGVCDCESKIDDLIKYLQ